MNRRGFLLGLLSSPASAALLPKRWLGLDLAKPGTDKTVLTLAEYSKRIYTEKQHILDLLNSTNDLMETLSWAKPLPLDSPAPAWHDPNAGGDQID